MRTDCRKAMPGWHNAPVALFGSFDARLLIVGLAPGLKGANRTGRAFTGDSAGALLYETLIATGFARATHRDDPSDDVMLIDCLITNAVRCVPPANKPTGTEIASCRRFLSATIQNLPSLRAILALGRIAHESTLRALGERLAGCPFAHGARHVLPAGILLFDSFHCSRYNTNTGRLTPPMFQAVFEDIRATRMT